MLPTAPNTPAQGMKNEKGVKWERSPTKCDSSEARFPFQLSRYKIFEVHYSLQVKEKYVNLINISRTGRQIEKKD